MADLYIRTQDRKRLCALGNGLNDIRADEVFTGPGRTKCVVQISDGIPDIIGEYQTIERCLEIIDDIQKTVEQIGNTGISPVVYEMPKA